MLPRKPFNMDSSFDNPLDVSVIAACLRMDESGSRDLLESLADQLTAWLPESTKVVRDGWLLSAKHPVRELSVSFPNYRLQLIKEKHGSIEACVVKIVKNVALKTDQVSIEDWINLLAEELSKIAKSNAQMHTALRKLVIG
jgi:hypothetical protein